MDLIRPLRGAPRDKQLPVDNEQLEDGRILGALERPGTFARRVIVGRVLVGRLIGSPAVVRVPQVAAGSSQEAQKSGGEESPREPFGKLALPHGVARLE